MGQFKSARADRDQVGWVEGLDCVTWLKVPSLLRIRGRGDKAVAIRELRATREGESQWLGLIGG